VKDQEIGLLNLVKALKEIEGIDLEHVEKLLNLSRILSEKENINTQQTKADNELTGKVSSL
jgi:hypothetical protein